MELEKEKKEERIRITERDILGVGFVVEQGFATIEQLWKVAWSESKSFFCVWQREGGKAERWKGGRGRKGGRG